MKKKSMIVLAALLLVLTGITIGGFLLIDKQADTKVYKEKMEEGRNYFSRMMYEEAIASFEFALEKNPGDEEAYVSIYHVRSAQGETTLALRALREGYRETKSDRLKEMLSKYEEKLQTPMLQEKDKAEIIKTTERKDEAISINVAMVQKLQQYNFAAYEREFGRHISNEMTGDSLEMVHGKIQAIFVYQDARGEEKSIDGAKNMPRDHAKPAYITLQNLSLLFRNFETGLSFGRLQEIVGSKVKCEDSAEAGSKVVKFTYGGCEFEIACADNGDIVQSSAWNKIIPPKAAKENGKVAVDGIIVNAVTGEGLQGAALIFEPEERNMDTIDIQTGSNGIFETELEPGVYEVEVSHDGFITDTFDLEVEAESPVSGINFPLSPTLSTGEIRIVLTWNAFPTDLDSHLGGTSATGKRFEVYFAHPQANDGNQQIALLDVDETGGFGPETTTVYMDGSYDFWVEDFTHSGQIGSSGAQVKVYMGNGGAPEVFDVPQGSGNRWNVFSIENGSLRQTNTITE